MILSIVQGSPNEGVDPPGGVGRGGEDSGRGAEGGLVPLGSEQAREHSFKTQFTLGKEFHGEKHADSIHF